MVTLTARVTRTTVIHKPRTTTTTRDTPATATRLGTTPTHTVGVVVVDTPWPEVPAMVEARIMDLTGVRTTDNYFVDHFNDLLVEL